MKKIIFEDALVVEPAKVDVLDELPVGSVIDYDGDEIPAGWEKVEATDDYSTEETFTGKYWIDGKKIYRKVIDFGMLPDANTKSVPHNISNLDFIIDYKIITSNGTTFWELPVTSVGDIKVQTKSFVNKTNITIDCGSNRSDYTSTYVTLEYTKTTE